MRDVDIVIPAAGMSTRMKSGVSKALTVLDNGETIIGRQVRLLHESHLCSKIVVVTGMNSSRIKKALPTYVQCVMNAEYETTNVAHSVSLGLQQTDAERVLIVYGDIIFSRHTIHGFSSHPQSSIMIDNGDFRKNEVGVTVVNGKATQFSPGLKDIWSQIALLYRREQDLFQQAMRNQLARKYFGYEILNTVLSFGGELTAYKSSNMILEVDSTKDLSEIQTQQYDRELLDEDFMQLHAVRSIIRPKWMA
jgi:choline kinase